MASELSAKEADDPIWLVKAGDRVMGPFTRAEIKTRLFEKEIVVIDEVITPTRRWRYIRDEPLFAAIVEEIRKLHLNSRDDTELGTFSKTIDDPEKTVTPIPISTATASSGAEATPRVRDVEAIEEKTTIVPPNRANGAPAAQVRSYGSSNDQRVQADIGRSNRAIWITAIVIVIVAGFLFYRFQNPAPVRTGGESSTILASARKARQVGDFRAAINFYEQLRSTNKADEDALIDLAVLRLRTGDESVPPSRILDSISAQSLSGERAAKFFTAKGLVALSEENRLQGARQTFDLALKADRSFAPAAFNRAMSDFIDPKFDFSNRDSAIKLASEFNRISSLPSLDVSGRNAAKIMSAIVKLKNRESVLAKQTREELEKFQRSAVQFWQEASFLRAYARYLSGQTTQAGRDLRITLGADPFVTDEHVTDPYLYVGPLSWRLFLPMCEEILNGVNATVSKPDASVETMYNFCRFKAGDNPEQVRERMDALEARSVSDPLVRSVSAYMVMGIAPEQAKAKVSDATAIVSWDLGRILRGRLCGHQDMECLYRTFRETALMPTGIYFKVGAARYLATQNDAANRMLENDSIEEVRRISPNYGPLLEYDTEVGR